MVTMSSGTIASELIDPGNASHDLQTPELTRPGGVSLIDAHAASILVDAAKAAGLLGPRVVRRRAGGAARRSVPASVAAREPSRCHLCT
ncbi:hypothetical protein BE20_05055 [Sorangium cellulosum]|uniref:Uncharacterized protein n=1 Tax=Sorangium cellulosum TaxID=56 RepID=A0A150RCW5_SORCE|nr:hypothetical protein BE18_42520 [Sorangium cellulosum]KYF94934.1 hypothetical protein BE20_05055 [Sorangium cellulosum]